jgi:hypothetical protein
MSGKKNMVTQNEINKCSRHISKISKKPMHQLLSNLLREMQIILDEPDVEDSIDGKRIRLTYITTIGRKRGKNAENVVRFQYIKEIPIDYSRVPIGLRDYNMTSTKSEEGNAISRDGKELSEDIVIESYDELEQAIPTLCEILGLLKRLYFMPEDFSNRLFVDRIHELRKMLDDEEILTFPSIDLGDNAGLVPI